ncbi:MAG: RNA methyltransferase, partial [Firmicutes bacterium]|nr:RNA methyltransferase [Bacillota bacterium]
AEALATGTKVREVLFLPEWAASSEGRRLLSEAEKKGARPIEVGPRAMARAATTDNPPPVLAVAPFPIRELQGQAEVGLVLDGLQDPGNAGTILRAAWGAGADLVWAMPGTVDLFAPKVMRAAQGAHFHLVLKEGGVEALLLFAREGGWRLIATEPHADMPYWRARMARPCLLCIGNEARGLSAPLREAAGERVNIPLAPGVDSLNAALSAGILLFELVRRKAED